MDSLGFLQKWFASECDGDWEHGSGIRLETLDNPGWTLTVELTDTNWENVTVPRPESFDIEDGQVLSWVEDCKFHAVGNADRLLDVIDAFRIFIEENHPA